MQISKLVRHQLTWYSVASSAEDYRFRIALFGCARVLSVREGSTSLTWWQPVTLLIALHAQTGISIPSLSRLTDLSSIAFPFSSTNLRTTSEWVARVVIAQRKDDS